MDLMTKILYKIASDVKEAAGTYPGVATPWDVGRDPIINNGPAAGGNRDSDSDNQASEPRGILYKTLEKDLIDLWGQDSPYRPNGMETVVKEKKCKNCRGKGCEQCHNTGIKVKRIKRPIVAPASDGQMREQLRYKDKNEGGPYGPWNRDFENQREAPYTFDEYMNTDNNGWKL
jgi:hypothetical protein